MWSLEQVDCTLKGFTRLCFVSNLHEEIFEMKMICVKDSLKYQAKKQKVIWLWKLHTKIPIGH
jgi:hypothetical protein